MGEFSPYKIGSEAQMGFPSLLVHKIIHHHCLSLSQIWERERERRGCLSEHFFIQANTETINLYPGLRGPPISRCLLTRCSWKMCFCCFEGIVRSRLGVILCAAWPDWAIYWTLGNFLKPLATINWSKSPTFLGNFCKGAKIYHFSSEIILRQLL